MLLEQRLESPYMYNRSTLAGLGAIEAPAKQQFALFDRELAGPAYFLLKVLGVRQALSRTGERDRKVRHLDIPMSLQLSHQVH